MHTQHWRVATALTVAATALAGCGTQIAKTEEPPATTQSGTEAGLPARFRIESAGSVQDCRVNGENLSCTGRLEPLPDNYELWTAETTGTVSGLTFTGTSTTHEIFHSADRPECRTVQTRSGSVTYEFSGDGTVLMSEGQMLSDTQNSGPCPGAGTYSGKQWGGQGTGVWSPIE